LIHSVNILLRRVSFKGTWCHSASQRLKSS